MAGSTKRIVEAPLSLSLSLSLGVARNIMASSA